MKKLKIWLLLALSCLVLVGCAPSESNTESNTEPNTEIIKTESGRFTFEVDRCNGFASAIIITDTDTGAQYLFIKNGYGGGMTVLEG